MKTRIRLIETYWLAIVGLLAVLALLALAALSPVTRSSRMDPTAKANVLAANDDTRNRVLLVFWGIQDGSATPDQVIDELYQIDANAAVIYKNVKGQ